MERISYETVQTTTERENGDNSVFRKYLLRQIFTCSGVWVSFFSGGLSLGSPTVLIPQLRKEANSSDFISTEMTSWLSSSVIFSGSLNSIILSVLARFLGRKLSFLISSGAALIGVIFLYYSRTPTQILIGEIMQGPLIAGALTVSLMVLTEYTSPRYRGVFLTLKSATFLCGIWIANVIGTFFHWKNILIVQFICSIYSLVTALFWPESPYWLIYRNNFEKGAASHRWLKGRSRESETEFELLIQFKKKLQSTTGKSRNLLKKLRKMFGSEMFYKPIILSTLVASLYHFSGKIACGMYAIDIIKQITGTESAAYAGMLILDGITVLGMYVGCGLSKILKRRTLLLVSSTVGVMFLFCISLYLYLIHLEVIVENSIVSISLLMCYSLAISIGPMIMASTILGELIPVKYRDTVILLLGCIVNFVMGAVVKISPFIFSHFGVRGLFLFFFITEGTLTVINYKTLPETKDKTIVEIQQSLISRDTNLKTIEYLNRHSDIK